MTESHNESLRPELDEELQPIVIPLDSYRFFLAHMEECSDALPVWSHLIFTAHLQGNRTVWATESYLQNGLKIGRDRVKRAKAFLRQHGLIEYADRPRDAETKQFKKGEPVRIVVKGYRQPEATVLKSSPEGDNPARPEATGLKSQPPGKASHLGNDTNLKRSKGESEEEEGTAAAFEALCQDLAETGRLRNDFFKVSRADREKLKPLFEQYGAAPISEAFGAWVDRPRKTPPADLLFFLEDAPAQLFADREREAAKGARRNTCADCGRSFPLSALFDGRCQACEAALLRDASGDPPAETKGAPTMARTA